ncbi:Spore maturation protein A [Botrimarina colliarenosi]|uniref:Spore maturation protein A n=1 Tax=Botrimarina colliarenosi TaxID=2528001 RepID=A0A5C6A4Z7_9BACT|nr:nucleoside recognition domain-containing protein [Botrimarina colliarenosi]TWT93463.1 Spore maturation protein A [Botrimarina colliarenosi]
MLNRIWFWLIVIGILYAPAKMLVRPLLPLPAAEVAAAETPPTFTEEFAELGKRVTESAIDGANVAVELLLSLIGIMVLWLGLMQVAKDAGLVDALAWLLRPLMRWLFPDVPEGHPAHGAMLMNLSANVLGLDNAATPFGLKAMQELQELNPDKETATDAMATFLAINTSSVTLVPISVIGYRIAAGSDNPAGPLAYIMLATLVSTVVGVTAVRTLSKLPAFAIKPPATAGLEGEA